MTYGERVKLARERAKLTQVRMAEICGVTQPTISQIETTVSIGSAYTTRFARACGVSAEWLADEIGEMVPTIFQTSDMKVGGVLKVMEGQPEYVKDAIMKEVVQTIELVHQARARPGANTDRNNNGTDG